MKAWEYHVVTVKTGEDLAHVSRKLQDYAAADTAGDVANLVD